MATATLGAPNFDQGLRGAAGTVRRDVEEVLGSGQFYVTPELNRELKQIHSGVEHIKLDQDFIRSSRDWGTKLDPRVAIAEKHGASQALDQAAANMYAVKDTLGARRIKSLQDNQARQAHHEAMQKLQGAEQAIGPYANASVDRIKQFCDHIGVTDRYTGYRNNLNRGSRDPVRLGYGWLDSQHKNVGSMREASTSSKGPLRHSLSAPATRSAAAVSSESLMPPINSMTKPKSSRCIQEQCGINMSFPGHTEYMTRYTRPRSQILPDYKINPSPDFTIYGRPNAKAEWLKNNTEYQTRYEWPDSAKIDKRPWIRK